MTKPTTSSNNSWLQWALMNAIGLALGTSAGRFFYPLAAGLAGGRVVIIEAVALGIIMGGIQLYALSHIIEQKRLWFILSSLAWALGWGIGWSWGWRLIGDLGLNAVLIGRGAMIGLLTGLAQWWLLRPKFDRAMWWIVASFIGWTGGFFVTIMVKGALAWVLGGGIAGAISGLLLAKPGKTPPQTSNILSSQATD